MMQGVWRFSRNSQSSVWFWSGVFLLQLGVDALHAMARRLLWYLKSWGYLLTGYDRRRMYLQFSKGIVWSSRSLIQYRCRVLLRLFQTASKLRMSCMMWPIYIHKTMLIDIPHQLLDASRRISSVMWMWISRILSDWWLEKSPQPDGCSAWCVLHPLGVRLSGRNLLLADQRCLRFNSVSTSFKCSKARDQDGLLMTLEPFTYPPIASNGHPYTWGNIVGVGVGLGLGGRGHSGQWNEARVYRETW